MQSLRHRHAEASSGPSVDAVQTMPELPYGATEDLMPKHSTIIRLYHSHHFTAFWGAEVS